MYLASNVGEKKKIKGPGYNPAPAQDLKDGQRVRHNAFGEGVVISTEGEIITIAFMKAGLKKLSTQFAELEKV